MRCKECNNAFTPNGTEFCGRSHQRKYEIRTKTCPVGKKTYDSADAAWAYIDSRPDDKIVKHNLRPYDNCVCGKFHVGHGEANQYSRSNA